MSTRLQTQDKDESMVKKVLILLALVLTVYLAGCATVPMAPTADDQLRKQFAAPLEGHAGLYMYRNSNFGSALTKVLYLDGQLVGATAPMTYFYREVSPGNHTLSTQSEFGNNDLIITTDPGKNYYVHQYIKMGVFVGGANLELVPEEDGKKGVLECKLAK
jgi:Protein of unknown function (DUF2846)